ncbi:MAG: AAA family ATPase [Beijerinckiaceae bacterium]
MEAKLSERVFIVGPNASGKTNLLDIFRFLGDIVKPIGGGLVSAVADRGGVKSIRCLEARGKLTDIVIDIDVGTQSETNLWGYTLAFTHSRKRETFPVITREEIRKDGYVLISREKNQDDELTFSQTLIQQASSNLEFRGLVDFLSSIRYLNVIPQIVRDQRRALKDQEDVHGGDLLNRIAEKTKKVRDSRLKKIILALQIVLPQFVDLRFEQDKVGRPHLVAKFAHWRPSPSDQNEEVFSDGTLRLIGFLWSILEEGGPLLLEEPELNLHEEAVRQIAPMIARMQRQSARQVILTTHSSAIIGRGSNVTPHEVYLLEPGDNGTRLTAGSDDADIVTQYSSGMSMAEIVRPLTRPRNINQLSLLDMI